MARTATSNPLRGSNFPAHNSRCRALRSAAAPPGVNAVTSTPEGTTEMRKRGTPMRTSSTASSTLVARMCRARVAISRSNRMREGGLVSARPWCLRLTVPKAWKVTTTGMSKARAASSAASADIQKCACTSCGRSVSQCLRRKVPNSPRCGRVRSRGNGSGGPAGTCTTR
ncbi:Uncharacterised protein [Mycobacteroides abscessus subsp. abscessus]|nr:Uncharacterised protein [Mycobacteroides abscessus subsp. abscessus]